MKLRVGAATDIGRARQRNEDAFWAKPPLYVVADGMGGHRGGEVASSLAVEVMSREEPAPLPDRVRDANRAVFDRSAGDRSVAGMGTTVTAVEVDGGGRSAHLAHVGDSRAYLLRGSEFRALTQDHTLVQQMVDEGKITATEAHDHPQRNILTRVVGVDPDVAVDEQTLDMHPGDRLVLCSDGLTSMMRDQSIQEILDSHADAQDAAESLVDAANRAGGLDNITVVVIDFVEGDGVELLGAAAGGASERPAAERRDTSEAVPVPAGPAPDETGLIEAVPRRRHRLRRWLVGIAIVLLVIAGGLVAFRMYLDSQWYVGVSNGHVAVYRGSPGDVLGIGLSGVVYESNVPARDAEQFQPYKSISDGLTEPGRAEAFAAIQDIKLKIRQAQRAQRKKGAGP